MLALLLVLTITIGGWFVWLVFFAVLATCIWSYRRELFR